MIIKQLTILHIICFCTLLGCKANRNINMLSIDDIQVHYAIKTTIEEESKYGDLNKKIIIVKTKKIKNSYEIRIGALYKEDVSHYLSNKKDAPYGFLELNGVYVIVFGENNTPLFLKNNITNIFPFLESTTSSKLKNTPPPPVIYEPIVWIYTYVNRELKLEDKGRFTLLL